jgi:hypothetical protein
LTGIETRVDERCNAVGEYTEAIPNANKKTAPEGRLRGMSGRPDIFFNASAPEEERLRVANPQGASAFKEKSLKLNFAGSHQSLLRIYD